MSQLVSDLDFSIGSERRLWIADAIVVVLFNLQHDVASLLEVPTHRAVKR